MFASGGFTAADLVGDKRWRTMSGGKVFSDCSFRYVRSVRCAKDNCSVPYVTGYGNHCPVITGRVICASVDSYGLIKFCLLNLYTEYFPVCVREFAFWRIVDNQMVNKRTVECG